MGSFKKVKVEDAVGMRLAHDITKIIPDKFKGVGFKNGHVIREEDVAELIKIGKRNIFILEVGDNELHEDAAAIRIAPAICGRNLKWTSPKEGKSNLICETDGLLRVQADALLSINMIGDIIVSTIKDGTPCHKGQIVAGTRIIPLMIVKEKIEALEEIGLNKGPILEISPYIKKRIGLVVTGSEIYEGLMQDESEKYVSRKVEDYGARIVKKIIVTDDPDSISNAIISLKEIDCEIILITGGLSVDPDDVTRQGVRKAGAEIISYGSPILPGAMFLNARLNGIPILGLPACVYYFKRTVYDLMLPRALAGYQLTPEEIAAMGHGGLCMNCEVCHFPACPLGK
jgi:molybdenum cofactor synthesis domain-containing protein